MISRSTPRSECGTSLIEFAFVAPVIIFLLLGMIELGRFGYFAILAANAARAGAQYGAQDLMTAYDTAGITNAAVQDGQNLTNWTTNGGAVTVNQLCAVNGGTLHVCGLSIGGPGAPQNTIYYVQVQVQGEFNSLLNYPGLPSSLPISGSATMRVATQ
jgi:Flp pilus assembly protein TadG